MALQGEGAGVSSVDFSAAFAEIDAELSAVQQQSLQQKMQAVQQQVNSIKSAGTETPFVALPSQGPSSLELHSAVVEHYGKLHRIEKNLKKRQSRRATKRDAKKRMKSESYKEKKDAYALKKLKTTRKRRRNAVY